MSTAAELVARCFAARTAAHYAHLRTKSYATHVALEAFYEGVIEGADSFIECFQGLYGVVDGFPDVELCAGELKPVKELRDWLSANRDKVSKGQTELANLIDEITALCDRTIYKLVNLK